MTTHGSRIEEHPDLMELRARYERAATTPQARAVEGLTLLAGLYLAVSPWVVGFFDTGTGLTINNLITGLAVAILALGFGSAYERTHGLGWVVAAIGIWTIITPWVVYGPSTTTGTMISNVVTGAVIFLLGLATSAFGMKGDTRTQQR
ncbi:SPW repeat protein [Streptomyces sp. NBRC 110028]|uniref:SPW repeat protein n=1 Tax=Streptomyces sp. NBRC 110028 TaxID=1621260 RepID=UPI0006E11ED2|nr:SPW repeat protein [Streptomyces sp. NBRC 110028]